MKPEKEKLITRERKSAKEIESEADLTPVEGKTFVDKEKMIDKEVLQLLASHAAYIESGSDETGTESLVVKRKDDNRMIFYTIFPWEIEEIKKVYELANTPK